MRGWRKNQANKQQHTMRFWVRYYPKSFLSLILVGFLLVALPFVFALIYSAVSIDQLAEQNRDTIFQAEQIAQGSRVLVDEIADMEHSVKLSLILSDGSLLSGYFQAHNKFVVTAALLAALRLNREQQQMLNSLRTAELALYKKVWLMRQAPADLKQPVSDFVPLVDDARNFLDHDLAPIEQEVNALQTKAARSRQIVLWQLLALLPFAVLLGVSFSVLIARPIRQIDRAIRLMGQGDLSKSVAVNGPQDLRRLGDRLNWMRLRLLELEQQKTKFLRHISHELKTPLTSIREGADLLADGVLGSLSHEQQHVAEILLNNSVQLQKRIEDLLNYSALQADYSVLFGQRVALRPLLESVVHDQQLAMMNKNLYLDLQCSDLTITCDEAKFKTIVDNLLSNAVKFSPHGACIKLAASQVDNTLIVDVLDVGAGVDPADQPHIFDAFYCGKAMPFGHIKGTGLGLSIAREYAIGHGGHLELMRINSLGAHFRLTLPMDSVLGRT